MQGSSGITPLIPSYQHEAEDNLSLVVMMMMILVMMMTRRRDPGAGTMGTVSPV